ncbi:(2Fe-2S) ferredoxin [Labrys miyagiensis]|uniref:(2Fe-2S) ferredoxin n=1 Tax=Labrys miyagiensis TaxID=346912 RepID=A0ABQ6CGR3_9HYPH|nr:aromatic ring-hydroxylating dioxygenase subunit alpha [Labrys miyagiensis]GLS19411.1 (2Fe-2S) ferredoxin [Labrys miyagiensis]
MNYQVRDISIPAEWDRSGLPAWTYSNPELLELEKDVLFRRHWQLICHVSNLPNPGDYVGLDMIGERALVVRGRDGVVRAFHNVCRHRGSRVVAENKGNCRSAIVCPFHGWSYNLDGTLRGAAQPKYLPALDPASHGLIPLETEIWQGFVFVRFKPGPQPSVAELMAPFEAEVAPYRVPEVQPLHDFWHDKSPVNWKSVRDVDNEGYHVPMAHPGLRDLYGHGYYDEPFVNGVSRAFGPFNKTEGTLWSVRKYKKLLPEATHLPESHRRAWLYLGLFPNTVLTFYPDTITFYQEFPLSTGETLQRGGVYGLQDDSRAMKAARFLSTRIDWDTVKEDMQLMVWSYEATSSSGYQGVILSDLEYGVKTHHDHLRRLIPVLNSREEPVRGELMRRNEEMRGARG